MNLFLPRNNLIARILQMNLTTEYTEYTDQPEPVPTRLFLKRIKAEGVKEDRKEQLKSQTHIIQQIMSNSIRSGQNPHNPHVPKMNPQLIIKRFQERYGNNDLTQDGRIQKIRDRRKKKQEVGDQGSRRRRNSQNKQRKLLPRLPSGGILD